MTTHHARPPVVRGPAEILAVLPYSLGFHPERSLVLVGLAHGVLTTIQRIDLVVTPTPGEAQAYVEHIWHMADVAVRADADAAVLVAYEDLAEESEPALNLLAQAVGGSGIDVLGMLWVRHGRWGRFDRDDPDCPSEGLPLLRPADVPTVADFVALGVAPAASRERLADRVTPTPGDRTTHAVGAAVHRRVARRRPGDPSVPPRRVLATWRAFLTGCEESDGLTVVDPDRRDLTPAELASVAVSLLDVQWRDAVIGWLCPGTLPLDALPVDVRTAVRRLPRPAGAPAPVGRATTRAVHGLEVCLHRLCAVLSDETGEVAAAVLTLAANVAWWRGDGAMASTCLERALDIDPGYRLADLLDRAVAAGVRPPVGDIDMAREEGWAASRTAG